MSGYEYRHIGANTSGEVTSRLRQDMKISHIPAQIVQVDYPSDRRINLRSL